MYEKWVIVAHGVVWSIRGEESGDSISDDIPHGSIALHIAHLHNKGLDSSDTGL